MIRHKCINIVEKQYIGDPFITDRHLGIAIIISWINNNDLFIIRRQKRYKAIGIGILKDHQAPLVLIFRFNSDQGVVSAEKYRILILCIQSLHIIYGGCFFLSIIIGYHIIIFNILGFININGIVHIAYTAVGRQRSLEIIGNRMGNPRNILLQAKRFTERFKCVIGA